MRQAPTCQRLIITMHNPYSQTANLGAQQHGQGCQRFSLSCCHTGAAQLLQDEIGAIDVLLRNRRRVATTAACIGQPRLHHACEFSLDVAAQALPISGALLDGKEILDICIEPMEVAIGDDLCCAGWLSRHHRVDAMHGFDVAVQTSDNPQDLRRRDRRRSGQGFAVVTVVERAIAPRPRYLRGLAWLRTQRFECAHAASAPPQELP